MKLLLTSAGLTNDAIAQALSDLAGKPLTDLKLIFIPTAANTEGEDKGWLIDNLVDFQKRNFKSIDISDIAGIEAENWQKRFMDADVICFGGGNEQYLAKVFEKIKIKDFLLSILDTKVYMGISAGSMTAGQFLSHELLRLVYPEETFEDTLAKPLGFYNFSFIPHLNSEWFAHVRKENLESIRDRFVTGVYATDDHTAIKIIDDKVEIVGNGDYWMSK